MKTLGNVIGELLTDDDWLAIMPLLYEMATNPAPENAALDQTRGHDLGNQLARIMARRLDRGEITQAQVNEALGGPVDADVANQMRAMRDRRGRN